MIFQLNVVHLIIKNNRKLMFGFIKTTFARLLTTTTTTTVVFIFKKWTAQSTIINLHPNEYTQGLHYYSSAVNLDKCVRSCNTFNDLSNKLCIRNKTEDLSLSVFNMITEIKEIEDKK